MQNLPAYIHQFNTLNRANNKGGAPHKPILLLAIINLVRNGAIKSHTIEITAELVLEFKDVWTKLVVTEHIPTFSLPFFHLKTEPFWKLFPKVLPLPQSISSLGVLKRFIWYAEIDIELYHLLNNAESSAILENALLQKYFPSLMDAYRKNFHPYASTVEMQILNDDKQEYKLRINELADSLSNDVFEDEIFARGGVFKKVIPRIYNCQCAISGMRIESISNAQMVDACHIIPFAESKDDTITNGFCLSPNLHRAFDRGLIKITEDYRVKLSSGLTEKVSPYGIKQFDNKEILLPDEKHHFPLWENFRRHGERWGEMF